MNLKSVKAEINYRGHTIAASREPCQAGHSLLYFTIVRNSDLFIVVDSFTEEDSSPAKYVNLLTERVDTEIAEEEQESKDAVDRLLGSFSVCCNASLDESHVIKAGPKKGHGKRYCSACGKFAYLV